MYEVLGQWLKVVTKKTPKHSGLNNTDVNILYPVWHDGYMWTYTCQNSVKRTPNFYAFGDH